MIDSFQVTSDHVWVLDDFGRLWSRPRHGAAAGTWTEVAGPPADPPAPGAPKGTP